MFDFVKQFAKGYLGTGTQDNSDYSPELIAVMQQAAKNALASGRMNIDYEDYPTLSNGQTAKEWVHGERKGSPLEKAKLFALDPVSNAATTIGGATLAVEDGNVYLTDEYDFTKINKDYKDLGAYGKIRKWAGDNFPEEGNQVRILLGKQEDLMAPPVTEQAEITIQSGDTLSKIAREYGTSISELAALNGIDNPNMIRAGQSLILPPMPQEEPQRSLLAVAPESKANIPLFSRI